MIQQLGAQAGLLAVQLTTAAGCGTGRTLTISAFATWTATTFEDTTWEAAASWLAEVGGPLY